LLDGFLFLLQVVVCFFFHSSFYSCLILFFNSWFLRFLHVPCLSTISALFLIFFFGCLLVKCVFRLCLNFVFFVGIGFSFSFIMGRFFVFVCFVACVYGVVLGFVFYFYSSVVHLWLFIWCFFVFMIL